MRKYCYIDTETTGLDAKNCDIWQIGVLIDIDGKVEATHDFKMAPRESAELSPEALELSQFNSYDDFFKLPDRKVQFQKLQKVLERYVSKYKKEDKFLIIGYNINFDIQFLRSFWLSFGNNYFGSYFLSPGFDVMGLVALYAMKSGIFFKNFKLKTVCDFFGIEIDAHDALSDIQATRELHKLLEIEGVIQK